MTAVHFTVTCAFALSISGLALYRKHLVSALLCIESMMLTMFVALTMVSQLLNTSATSLQPVVLLALAACGAGVGLALLVATTRAYASDHLKNLNLLKC